MNLFLVLILGISLLVGEAYSAKCRLYHKVRPGDSLWKIADRYNLYIKDILRANPKLKKSKYLRVGQKVCIPYKKKAKKRKRKTYKREYIIYRVRPGDSLQKIGKKFGVSWKEIKRVNRLRSNVVRRGQLLKIPVPKSAFERRYLDKPRIKLSFLPVDGKYTKVSRGLDIYASCGEKVRAVDSGRVIYSGDDLTPYGNMVIVEHPGYLTIYAYNMQNLVERGDRVSKGEVIAKVGLKPGSGKCALHFEVRTKDGAVLNPLEYLGKK